MRILPKIDPDKEWIKIYHQVQNEVKSTNWLGDTIIQESNRRFIAKYGLNNWEWVQQLTQIKTQNNGNNTTG